MPVTGSPTHLIIVSPAALQREAWSALLSGRPGIVVSGAAGDAPSLAALSRPVPPVTVLADLPAPSPEIARRLKGAQPEAGLLFLVGSYELDRVLPLLRAGASGCVSRDEAVEDLVRAIVAAGRGEISLPPPVAARALAALARGEPVEAKLADPLSERETEVLRLLARGLTNKDIAQALFLSVRTVEAHLRGVFAKLGVRSRTEAALWAVEQGYGRGDR